MLYFQDNKTINNQTDTIYACPLCPLCPLRAPQTVVRLFPKGSKLKIFAVVKGGLGEFWGESGGDLRLFWIQIEGKTMGILGRFCPDFDIFDV